MKGLFYIVKELFSSKKPLVRVAKVVGFVLVLFLIGLTAVLAAKPNGQTISTIFSFRTGSGKPDSPPPREKVLADTTKKLLGKISFNIPTVFNDTVDFKKAVTFDGSSTFNGPIKINNQDVDIGTGTLTAGKVLAPNLIYGVTAGTGISITPGVGQKPVVTNTGVLSIGGSTGAIELKAGSGISINGTTISNTSQGGNSFGKIVVGGDTISAGSTSDTVTFAAGSGVALSADTSNNKVTITSTGGLSGLTANGVMYAVNDTTAGTITPGTTGYFLQSNGSGTPPSWVAPSALSTVSFNNITTGTNTSAAMTVGSGGTLTFSGSGTINASSLLGATWASPNPIGSTTPNTGAFSTLTGTTVNGLNLTANVDGFSLAGGATARSLNVTGSNITLTGGGNTLTMTGNASLNQNVLTSSSPTFSNVTLSGFSTNGGLLFTNGSGVLSQTGAGSSTTILHGGTTPTYAAVSLTAEVSGVLPIANGGTNTSSIGSAGSLPYSTGTAYGFSTVGSAGQCLTSGGSGAPTWTACAAGSTFWNSTNGALYPNNSTLDLLIGGTATASAKFAVTNMNSGTPIASLSAGAAGGLYVTADGTLSTTGKQTLTIGSASTGNIAINGFSTGIVHSNGSGILSSSAVALGTADVSGILSVSNGGSGATSFTSNGVLVGNGSGAFQVTGAGTTGTVLHGNTGSVPTFSAVSLTADISGILPIANGGTNTTTIGSAGSLAYSTGTAYGFSSVGTSGQCLTSGGAGTPTWGNCATGTNFWTSTNGSLYPINSTMDLFVGGSATSSAKFAVLNVNSGTPTASVSGATGGTYITADGTLQTTGNQNLTVGGTTTGNITLSPKNGAGTVTFAGYGSGIVHSNSSGTLTSSAVNLASGDVTGTLGVPNGGTGLASITSGSLVYGNGSSAMNTLGIGATNTVLTSTGTAPQWSTSLNLAGSLTVGTTTTFGGIAYTWPGTQTASYILQTNGAGALTWVNPATLGTNYWQLNSGALAPANTTNDILVGGNSTASAKFQIFSATGNATTAGTVTFDAAGNIQTTKNQTLTFGGSTTGNIVLSPLNGNGGTVTISGYGTGLVHSNASGLLSSSSVNLASADVTGTLVVGNGGTGTTSFTTNGIVYGNGSSALQVTAAGTNGTVLHGNTGGTPTFSAVSLTTDVSGILPLANGGTNANLTAANGAIAYSNASALALSSVGTSGQCLVSGGAGTPTWGNCTTGGGTNFWTSTNGSLYPINSTMDLFVGGTATASAKFAVTNINSGTPTASVSGATGGLYVTADGTLATTAKQSLTIGSASTGSVVLSGFGAGVVHTNAAGIISSSAVNLAGADVTGTLPVGNGGTGGTSFTSNGVVLGNGSGTLQVTTAGSANQVFRVPGGGGAPSFGAIDISQSAAVTGILPLANGGTNANLTAVNGSIVYSNATSLALSAVGTNGQCLLSSGAGTPTWGNCTVGGGTNFWTSTNGSLYPINSTMDLFVGGSATASAKFAVLNVNSGTPTATVSAGTNGGLYVTADGTLATTAKQTLTIGSSSTGNVAINGFSTGLVHANSSGILSSSAVNLAGVDVTGTLAVGNGGTGGTSFTSNGLLYGNGSSTVQVTGAGTTGTVLHGNTGSAPTFSAVSLTADVSGILPIGNGGTNANTIGGAGSLAYSTGTAYAFSSAGTSGQCLTSGGTGAPSWTTCAAGSNLWTTTAGAIYPIDTTSDLLVRGTATASAKFAFINVSSGTPTASVSAGATGAIYLTADGKIQTTANQNLTVGGDTTGNITLSPKNGTGTITFNGYGTGVVHSNSSGLLSSSAINLASADVSGILPIGNGGTNANTIGGAGSLAYSTGTAYSFSSVGTSGQCLTSGGTGAPSWTTCAAGSNLWTTTAGAIYPIDTTADLLVGGTATASAKFAFINVSSGTPTASVSAGANGGLYVTADGILATTAKQTLTLGSASTGNVAINEFSTGVVHSNASGILSSSAIDLASVDVTGTLGVPNGGTGGISFTSNGVVLGNGSGALAVTAAGSANQVFRVPGGGGAPAFGAIDLSQSAAVTGILPLANGGTNANLIAVNGGVVYSGASALAISAAGTNGQCLLSSGAGTPTWGNCTTGG